MPKSIHFDLFNSFLSAACFRRLKNFCTLFITSLLPATAPVFVNLLFSGDDLCLSDFLFSAL